MLRIPLVLVLLLLASPSAWAQVVDPMEWTLVGDAGAAGDEKYTKNTVKFVLKQRTGWGEVPYEFLMTRWDVTVGQYIDFLNAVACSDTGQLFYGLWGPEMRTSTICDPDWDPVTNPTHMVCFPAIIERTGAPGSYVYAAAEGEARREDLPFNAWTYWRALKFANWLDNGQPNACDGGPNPTSQNPATTEDGSYTLTGLDLTTTPVLPRNPGHRFYVASYDEYYKAAHHIPGCTSPTCYNCYSVAGTSYSSSLCEGQGGRPPSSYPGCPDCEEPFDPATSLNNPGAGDCRNTTTMSTFPRDLASNPEDPFLDLRAACDLWWPVGTFQRTSAWGVAELHGSMTILTDTPLWLEGDAAPHAYSVMQSPQWWNSSGWDGRAVSTTSFIINIGGRVIGIGTRFVDHQPGATPSVCGNGLDDDGDGQVDQDDPGCLSFYDQDETQASLPCDDGMDNDGDGAADYPSDIGCRNSSWPAENPACQDGLNNDGKTGTDFDGGVSVLGAGNGDPDGPDPNCSAPWRTQEHPAFRCGLGFEGALLPLLLVAVLRRRARPSRVA